MRRARLLVVAALLSVARATRAQETQGPAWTLTGSYLNLATRSRTLVPAPQPFMLDLNRLRLRAQGKPFDQLAIDVQYDNELVAGDYLRTTQYALTRLRTPATSYDWEHEYYARGDMAARHRLYRATVKWSPGSLDITVGRQRIPLGTGFFWSPMDMLNPIDATRLERDYRNGADGILAQQKLGAVARLDAIHLPRTSRLREASAAYLHGNIRGADVSLLAGRFRGDDAIGADVAFSVNGIGVRGEATGMRTSSTSFARALVGVDYGFTNSLTLSGEAYFNGAGTTQTDRYDLSSLYAGKILNVGRWYGAFAATYQLTPLWKAASYVVANAGDGSLVLWPRLEWSVRSNLELAGGLQRFSGATRSEYGRLSNVLHVQGRTWF